MEKRFGKKQPWFFRDAKNVLSNLQNDMAEELERRYFRLLFTVSDMHGTVQFWVEQLENGEVVWSSLQIRSIVDFDIALEHLQHWWRQSNLSEDASVEVKVSPPRGEQLT